MKRVLLASFAAASLLARPADACAPAPPEGVRVQIAEESAIIVWDAAAKREHFIRRASFQGASKDFGFLVPTPAKPELAEVPDDVFGRLDFATRPEVRYDTGVNGIQPTALCALPFLVLRATKSDTAPAGKAVTVLDAKQVAGYDAVVLEADDAKALADWLKDHGYAARRELTAWLAPYVAEKWKISAFKIAGGAPAIATAAVRMTFATDRPFYPYREPTDQRENLPANAPPGRLLRVFFIGQERMDGALADGNAWPGNAIWSDELAKAKDAGAMPVAVPSGAWLTMFEDRAAPRPGTDDLFFMPAADRGPIKPPPIVIDNGTKIPLPLDVLGIGALVTGLWLRSRKRKAEAMAAAKS